MEAALRLPLRAMKLGFAEEMVTLGSHSREAILELLFKASVLWAR